MINFTPKKQICFALFFILFGLLSGAAQAQTNFGNEWIRFDQPYYKIKVINTGLHRLSYGYLDSLGLASVNPKHLQLFRRGQEVAIYVAGQADDRLDQQDYVEFFGERNNGALDAELYKNPAHQVHQLYSLYTDTASYFLTVSPQGGKRMREINPAIEGRTPEPYHLQKIVQADAPGGNLTTYYPGKKYGENTLPWMDAGEGNIPNTSRFEKTYNINSITDIEPSGPKPYLKYVAYARGNITHNFAIRVTNTTNITREIARHVLVGDGHVSAGSVLEFSDISGGRVAVKSLPDAHETIENQISVALSVLTFPQKSIYKATPIFVYTDSTKSTNPYYEFSGLSGAAVPASVVAYDVTDPANIIRIAGYNVNGKRGFAVDAEDRRSHKLLLTDISRTFKPAGKKSKVEFKQIDPTAYDYLIVSNKRFLTAPEQYVAYRASAAGGGYKPLVVMIDDLIDQFHYGEYSAVAIRKFSEFMLTSGAPKHLLLMGKGITVNKGNFRSATVRALDFVPAGGVPASDILFTADFRNNSYHPRISTGRITATKPDDILNYLQKIKEHEQLSQTEAWRKNILQLGGGSRPDEIARIGSYLTGYRLQAEGPLLGAYVTEKYRQNVSEVVESVDVSKEINAGVSLVTFFGHSSPGTTDLDIGYVSKNLDYKNEGKYPVILMNGCSAGDAFLPNSVSFGEDWLLTPRKGAINMIAHVESGYDKYLDIYSKNFYATAFQEQAHYGKPIGEVQIETIRKVAKSTPTNTATTEGGITTAMLLEMVMQGDPAVRMYTPDKPDYTFNGNTLEVKTDKNEPVTASSPKLNIKVKVDNRGKALPDEVTVKIKRTLSDNSIIESEPIKVGAILKKTILELPVNNEGINAAGMNKFEIVLDSPNAFDEFDENNNTGNFEFYFPVSGLTAITPADNGIVTESNVKIITQSTQLDESRLGYHFEVDTIKTFKSGAKQTYTTGNVQMPTWELNLASVNGSIDSTVYYWRARFQNYAVGEDTVWAGGSFRLIKNGQHGWSQSHHDQFITNTSEKVERAERTEDKWQFSPLRVEIGVKTVGSGLKFSSPTHGIFFQNRMELLPPCGDPTVTSNPIFYMMVVNDKTLEAVSNLVPQVACAYYPIVYQFVIALDSKGAPTAAGRTSLARMEEFLNTVPEGYHVIGMSLNKVAFQSFPVSLKEAFGRIGASKINDVKDGYPYGIVGRKGSAPGTAQEMTAILDPALPAPTSQEINLKVNLLSKQTQGTITSTLIGPALKWGTLYHNIERYKAGNDSYTLDLIGVDADGKQTLLQQDIKNKALDLSNIDAKKYPALQLRAALADTEERTAPQLKQWFVYYDAAPEGVVRPDLVKADEQTITEQARSGSIKVPMAFENISGTAFQDSITVQVTVSGDDLPAEMKTFKIKAAAAKEVVYFDYSMSTLGLTGNYKLSYYVNPRILAEQQYFNNIYEVSFKVDGTTHPVLDVAFDGVHIMDGELISPKPVISITVRDENRHKFLKDPSTMSVVMVRKDEDGQEEKEEISLVNNPQEVQFFPADEKNDFRLEYKPKVLANGKYMLVVQAKDVTGKASGLSPYQIGFEVVNEASVTNFYPYPNPFSSKTQFIFTLTGQQIPENMKIQIMTVTGKVVKEIMKEELGPLRIGNNKTEYAWDGTDTYGDKLANGVYLYRVVMSKVDEEMKHRNSRGDKAFKNGYGKLYILR
ncbi:putative type IX secretion system sortase PorU2 [Pontibacter arcticus]|uniref:Gingipain domain-containing protein n=1 Tax=Pontibacter arcticus TaxID=2080288 RepID=A0A364RBJ6_9BACT|nr:C25 family cysteine peptidase [Pontibacter arcticus]RAU81635.1 hypothetical protein DP923_13030 [Pontibacter arcticus]